MSILLKMLMMALLRGINGRTMVQEAIAKMFPEAVARCLEAEARYPGMMNY